MSQTVNVFPIAEVTGLDIAFGGGDMSKLMPAYKDIPDEFKRASNKWNQLFNDMFFSGISELTLKPKDGIDAKKAWRHLRAFAGSFEPKHEHKEAAFAYLCSQWFSDETTWTKGGKR